MNKHTKIYKIVLACLEGLLAIPLLGALIIIGLWWIPLFILFVGHTIALITCIKNKKKYTGHITGLVGSLLGWIPLIGWIMHVVTTIVLIIEIIGDKE